jgi:hypothetical protein
MVDALNLSQNQVRAKQLRERGRRRHDHGIGTTAARWLT